MDARRSTGRDALAVHALDILVRCFGAAAGDIALAHGAMGVAITGGLANRIAPLLRSPAFAARFTAKGRYRERMQRVAGACWSTDAEPGLLGAAVAFQREHGARFPARAVAPARSPTRPSHAYPVVGRPGGEWAGAA